jgi:hypothetical protein
MLGKIWRRKCASATAVITLATMVGCTRNIPQASHSGKDSRYKGAKQIELESGEGRTKGIVTYPGGDRVDWKYFEIPEEKKGSIKIRLKHKPPRPGLDVAFDVYDQYFARVGRAKPSKRGKRSKSLTIKNVETGKYYIQVYAPRRMDAGSYRLNLRFKERKEVAEVDISALADQIPEPPTLPAVPEPIVVDPVVAKQLEDEAAAKKAEEDARKAEEDANAPKPVTAKIVNVQAASGGSVIITLNKGKEAGVARGWTGKILRGGRDGSALDGGDFKVIKVTSRESVGKVKLSVDQVKANKYARLSP